MKPWSRRKWQAAMAGHAHNIQIENGALERQRRLDALKENHLSEHSTRADINEQELMAWSDDGGAAEIIDRAGD